MEAHNRFAAALTLCRSRTFCSDAVEQNTGGFVGRILRHEFALEILDKYYLIDMIN